MSARIARVTLGTAMATYLAVAICPANLVAGTVPALINYQGLVDDAGSAPITGTVSITFGLFGSATGGLALWSETHPSVEVLDGVFDVVLGSTTPLSPADFALADLWLEVVVDGEVMSPRHSLTSAPTAGRSIEADTLAAGSVTGNKIQDGAITPSKLAVSCGEGDVIRKTATGWQCHSLP